MSESSNVVGIDFGTTNSCISYLNNQSHPIVIQNPEGLYTTPSCIYYDINTSDILFGVTAQNLLQSNQNSIYLNNIITNVKRLVGMSYHEWTLNTPLQEFFKRKNTKIVKDEDGMVGIELTYNNRVVVLSTKHIIKSFLRYLKSIAHEYFGKPICEIVITVPAYFSDLQRCHIKECCEILDLKVLRIINEPTAAALAYGFDTNREHFSTFVSENVLVIDCGGGTTDISILLMDYEDQIFEVKNVTGNNFLGGEDITDSLVTYVIQKMGLIADNLTPKQFNKLKNGCESLKQQLSFQKIAKLNLESFEKDNDVQLQVSREELLGVCSDFFLQVSSLIKKTVLGYIVDKVVLVGGTTRVPYMSELCHSILGNSVPICNTLDPDQTISIGAAVQGYLLLQSNSGTKYEKNRGITILDIVPMSLGVETVGGLMSILVSKNTFIPTSRTQLYTNSEDHITELDINVYQGERRLVKDNKCLATFKLKGLNPDHKRGEMNVKVTFNVDANGILFVEAEETQSSLKQSVTINVEKVCGVANAFDKLSLEDDFVFQDSYTSNQILAKLELYDTLKYLLTFYHEHRKTFLPSQFEDRLLNELFNKVFDVVQCYNSYSPQQLQECKTSFERDFHNIIIINNADTTGSSTIE